MGLSFRKSKKIFPGIRLNLTTKGIGISGGTKGLRVSHSATGRKTFSAGIPGSGIRYRKNIKNQKNIEPNLNDSLASRINKYGTLTTPEERRKVLKWLYASILSFLIIAFLPDNLNVLSSIFSIFALFTMFMYIKTSRRFRKTLNERRELEE
jgi:hypothetical protein